VNGEDGFGLGPVIAPGHGGGSGEQGVGLLGKGCRRKERDGGAESGASAGKDDGHETLYPSRVVVVGLVSKTYGQAWIVTESRIKNRQRQDQKRNAGSPAQKIVNRLLQNTGMNTTQSSLQCQKETLAAN
jgi:hypothetical protein